MLFENNGQQQDDDAMQRAMVIQCKMKIPKAEMAKICRDCRMLSFFLLDSHSSYVNMCVSVVLLE